MEEDFVEGEDVFVAGVGMGEGRFVWEPVAGRVEKANAQTVAEEDAGFARGAEGLAFDVGPGLDGARGGCTAFDRGSSLVWRKGRRRPRNIDLSESPLVLVELPLPQKSERAHTKAQNRRDAPRRREQRRRVQDCAIASQCRGQVNSLLVLRVAFTITGGVDGEGEGVVEFTGDVGFEDEGDGGVGGVEVVCVFDESGADFGVVVFADEEDVAGWEGPVEGEEVVVAGL